MGANAAHRAVLPSDVDGSSILISRWSSTLGKWSVESRPRDLWFHIYGVVTRIGLQLWTCTLISGCALFVVEGQVKRDSEMYDWQVGLAWKVIVLCYRDVSATKIFPPFLFFLVIIDFLIYILLFVLFKIFVQIYNIISCVWTLLNNKIYNIFNKTNDQT
jgi:hypothetical protein